MKPCVLSRCFHHLRSQFTQVLYPKAILARILGLTGIDEMRNLQLGQGRDLHWSYHTHVPTPAQYISMVDGSTYWHIHLYAPTY